jgi:hypothetical protein
VAPQPATDFLTLGCVKGYVYISSKSFRYSGASPLREQYVHTNSCIQFAAHGDFAGQKLFFMQFCKSDDLGSNVLDFVKLVQQFGVGEI